MKKTAGSFGLPCSESHKSKQRLEPLESKSVEGEEGIHLPLSDNIRELEAKAKGFVKGRKYSDEILAYVQNVLTDPSFQQDPQYFMNKWEERGDTEEFGHGEDAAARMFF